MPDLHLTPEEYAARCLISPRSQGCDPLPDYPKCSELSELVEETIAASQPTATFPPGPMPAPMCEGEPPSSLCRRRTDDDAFELMSGHADELLSQIRQFPLAERLDCISRRFRGLPYELDPRGEGRFGEIDSDPILAFASFDCMTLVEETMALAASNSFAEGVATLLNIRYRGGTPDYADRRHFVEAEWIADNVRNGYILDITRSVSGGLTKNTSIFIDRIKLVMEKWHLPLAKRRDAATDFQKLGLGRPERASTDSIPIPAFFAKGKEEALNPQFVERLPDVSILCLVRKPEAARRRHVIIAHMGLIIVPRNADGTRGEPIFRSASPEAHAVVDEPLAPYLKRKKNLYAGVMILKPLEKNPESSVLSSSE